MSNIEDILLTQNQLKEEIEKLLRNFKKDGAERKTPHYIKKRLEILDSYWEEFQTNHTLLYQYEARDYSYFAENHYQLTKNVYSEARTFIEKYETSVEAEKKRDKSPSKTPTILINTTKPSGEPQTSQQQQQQQQLNSEKTSTYIKTKSQGNASKSEELLRKQKSNFKAFSRTLGTINLEQINEKWEFEDTLKNLEARWKTIDSLHWEIDSEVTIEDEYEQIFEIYERQYNSTKKAINTKMWSVSHKEKSTPKMDLPTFSGAYQHWTSFKDLFTEVIHDNGTLSSAQKMQYLKSKVKGEAEKLIQHLSISSDNYQVCWDILNNRYNNKKLIFTSHLNTILNLPVMQYQTASNIKRLHDTTNECLNAIKKLDVDISTWDPILVHLLSQKLDTESYNDYIEAILEPRELPNLAEFMRFLESKFTSLESVRRKQERPTNDHQQQRSAANPSSNKFQSTNKGATYQNYQNFNVKPKAFTNNAYNSTWKKGCVPRDVKCPLCKNEHGLFHCNDFIKLQTTDRRNFVAKHNLCKNCLYDHKGQQCKSDKSCLQCNSHHHTLLHDKSMIVTSKKNENVPSNSTNKHEGPSTNASMKSISETLLATAQVKVKTNDGSEVILRALIDQGSQISIISENTAQLLGLPRLRSSGVIFGIGTKESNCKGAVDLSCTSTNNNFSFDTQVYVMRNLVNNLPSRSFSKPSTWTHLEGIQLADPDFNISRPIDILFGAEVYSNIILGGIIKGDETQPMAQQSHLGWILCGNIKSYQCNVVLNNLEDIRKFWEIEDIAECTQMSSEDAHCLQQYKTHTKRQENGRYVVRLPLHSDIDEKLGESKPKAKAQFFQLEKRFRTSEHVAEHYKLFMTEYEELNHMQLCKNNMKPSFYLPHHCVQRVESKTTPLRVIFNASAKTSTGLSLNDLMYSGPNLQNDLLSLIVKWRQYKVAITADIEKHFRQILCHEKDQHYQKILWRTSPDQPLREYTLTTVTYGTKAAPFLAMMTLKQLANDERHNYPEAAAILETSFYTDDLLCSTDDIQTAIKLKMDLTNLLKSGGFNLRKWSSNEADLLQDEGLTSLKPEVYYFRHQETTKTLGLRWNPNEDNFTFQLTINTTSTQSVTKRTLLSEISKIFDPLGWLSPVTTKLKLIFQEVWKQEQRWDDDVPEPVNKKWEKVKKQLTEINELKIPRWLQIKQNENIEMHGFCDASINAYSCVIYNKTKHGSVVIVAAKSRLVPAKKTVSLPRLELCAAVLLSTLMKRILECLSTHNITMNCWSDSTAVLGWLQGDHNRWNLFVSNRVQKIKEIIPSNCWRYVKSADNPADCASRGILPTQLKTHSLWWNGPNWLSTFQPMEGQSTYYETNEEMKKLQTNITTIIHNKYDVIQDLLTRNSCLTRVTRVIAWVLRFTTRDEQRPNYLTASEIRKARNIILKHVQQNYFKDDILNLKLNKDLERNSKLLPLNPYFDADGLLRVGGRINNAYIDAEQKNPIIVPHDGHFTEMLIDNSHKITFHGGARVTSARLRKQYWIVGGNRAVKKRIFNCVKCRRHSPIQQTQLMGDLPAARCNPTRPFYHTGVDYTGYIDVKANKGRGVKTTKGYVAVFVCMVTKAVHLELVSDLTSTAFLAALRRLSARRGAPRHIHSDNATNFTGSNNSLKQEFIDLKRTLDPEFFSAITDMNIEWHFIAPSWPSAGGLWEGAVKSLKFHLRRVLGEQKLTYEELSTLLAQLEACLNSRPLLALTEDPEDIDYLTPSHFLSSGPNLTIIETEKDLRTRWQLVQKILRDVWKRWQSEYLTQLSPRSKWRQKKLNMKIDDLVVVHDSNLPAGKWALGRVVDLHEGKDECVRVVSVRTKNGIIKRPITKLSKLPISKSSEEDGQSKNKDQDSNDEENKPLNNEKLLQNKNKRTRRRNNMSCNLVWTILTMFTFMAPALCKFSLTSINANQSIYFDKVTDMHLIRDEWKLIVYYDMKPYWQGIQAFKNYIDTLQKTCTSTEKYNKCDVIILQLRHGYTELMHYSDMLLDQKLKPTRQRRGLIDGVGYLANSLFGILDEHFAEKYEKDIDAIQTNEKHLAQLWKNQTSVLEAENNIMKRVEQSIEKQHKIFNQHINFLDKAKNTLATEINDVKINNDFSLMSIIANNILGNLKGLQDTLLETITEIHYGKFNIHLLSPQQLTGELNIISGLLSKDLTLPVENLQVDLRKIYHLLNVKARMTPKYFIFEIKIPLITRDSYEIYKLIAVPQLIRETMMSILPIADYVAINLQKDAYIPMAEYELRICITYNLGIIMCSLQRPIHHLKPEDNFCEKNEATEQCETKQTICRDVWIELNKINTYMYFCCKLRTIRIICENQVTAERVSKAGIISLGNGCVIKGEAFTIYSHMQRSNYLTIQPDELKIDVPPINNIFNITIPSGVINITKDEDLTTYNDEINNQLHNVGEQIKHMKGERDGLTEISSHDVHQFVVLYILAGAALLVASVYLWRRSRARCSATLPVVTSEPAIQLVPTFVPTSIENSTTSHNRQDQHYARVDKATSPVIRKLFSATSASDSVK